MKNVPPFLTFGSSGVDNDLHNVGSFGDFLEPETSCECESEILLDSFHLLCFHSGQSEVPLLQLLCLDVQYCGFLLEIKPDQ